MTILPQPKKSLKSHSTFATTKPVFLEDVKRNCAFDCLIRIQISHLVCGCSEERIDTMLCSIGPEELASMIEELGVIEVVCEFCSTKYTRDKAAVDILIEKISYI